MTPPGRGGDHGNVELRSERPAIEAKRPTDPWIAGDRYEPYVGRWSRRVAAVFLDWLDVGAGRDWLDVGCGTGALAGAIAAKTDPRSVLGVEPSPGFVAYARARLADPRVRIESGDAQSLPLADASVDVAVAGLVLNFVPQPERAVTEMARATRPGGTVAAYVWDYAEGMSLMRLFWDAAVALDAAAQPLDEGLRFALCRPDPLARLFESAALRDVEVRPIDVATDFTDFDDYWSPFLGGQGPAPGYVASLDDRARTQLRERLRTRLPVDADGSIRLVARAWAVRGRRTAVEAPTR